MQLTFDSSGDLARALRRAADAYHQREETERLDPDWPTWYARYIEREQAETEHQRTVSPPLEGGLCPWRSLPAARRRN